MTRTIHFLDWSIEADESATSLAYAQLASGEAERCCCNDCLNWIDIRSFALPTWFVALLQKLGVDSQKETEISEYESGSVDSTMNLYSGEFLFHGRVLSGPDCFQPHSDGKGASVVLADFEGVRIGMSSNARWAMSGPASAKFQPLESCAVVVFQVRVPRGRAYGSEVRVEA